MPEKLLLWFVVTLVSLFGTSLWASEPIRVAVAANFAPTLKNLASEYQANTDQRFVISTGSSGKLYAQIVQGAPYDLFFSADSERPALLEQMGLTAGSTQTYALGRLVLWGADTVQAVNLKVLENSVGRIAIANPRLAPYGAAANKLLETESRLDEISPRLVVAENTTQVLQYVMTGQVDWAFLALSQIRMAKGLSGQAIEIDQNTYPLIRQQAVILKSGNAGEARKFLAYCLGEEGQRVLLSAGYGVPNEALR